jgi:hypothetical protein
VIVCEEIKCKDSEIKEIYKTFNAKDRLGCDNCTQEWMSNIYNYGENSLTLAPSILVRWAYALSEDRSDGVQYMYNKYTGNNPEYVMEWKTEFSEKITKIYEIEKQTDIALAQSKGIILDALYVYSMTVKEFEFIQLGLAATSYCIAFNCIPVDTAVEYWEIYRENVVYATKYHKQMLE